MRLKEIPGGRELIAEEYRKLGPVSRGEWIVLAVFAWTAGLWMFREALVQWNWLATHVPVIKSVDDSVVAMAGAIALFLIPVDPARHVFALDWKTAVKLPWGVLLLFGGGLSLAAALTDSGLARWIGQQVGVLAGLPTFWQIVLIVALIVFTGELKRIVSSVICQAFSVVQELSCLLSWTSIVPGSPARITRWPNGSGVGMFIPLRPGKSIFHSSSPVDRDSPTAFFCVSVTTCFTPPISKTCGEA